MFFTGIADEASPSIERQIVAHQALGWDAIELRNIDGTNLTDVSDATFDHIQGVLALAGMRVCCFAAQLANWGRPINTDFDRDVTELRRAIPRMHRLGTRYIRCMSYPNDGRADADWRDEVVCRLRELARIAEEHDVVLVHENCDGWGGQSIANTLELLERVDSPALRLVFDTGNTISHRQDAVAYLSAVIDHVVHVHIKDGTLRDDRTIYTYPGDGDARVAQCIRLLHDYGYDGGYSIEPHLAAIVHAGETGAGREQQLWDSYLEYGRRLMDIYADATAPREETV